MKCPPRTSERPALVQTKNLGCVRKKTIYKYTYIYVYRKAHSSRMLGTLHFVVVFWAFTYLSHTLLFSQQPLLPLAQPLAIVGLAAASRAEGSLRWTSRLSALALPPPPPRGERRRRGGLERGRRGGTPPGLMTRAHRATPPPPAAHLTPTLELTHRGGGHGAQPSRLGWCENHSSSADS